MTSSAAMAVATTPRGHAERTSGGLTLSGSVSLLAVVAVLVVVSVPRLRGLAVQENEADARATAQLLARALGELPAGPDPTIAELLRRPELAGLADAELLAEGRLLRRHGYLFELTRLDSPPGLPGSHRGPGRLVRAWPWAHGRTGVVAYLVAHDGTSLEHPNLPPRWQGLESAGEAPLDLAGWSRDS